MTFIFGGPAKALIPQNHAVIAVSLVVSLFHSPNIPLNSRHSRKDRLFQTMEVKLLTWYVCVYDGGLD